MKKKTWLICILFILSGLVLPSCLTSYAAISSYKYHLVKRGETLYGISRLYGISVDEIREKNHLSNEDKIYPGQKLFIPEVGIYHEVKERQTLWSIARTYYGGITAEEIRKDVERIMEANDLSSTEITVGQRLFIPGAREVLEVEVPLEFLSEKEVRQLPEATKRSGIDSVETRPVEIRPEFCWPVKGEVVRYFEWGVFNGIDIAAPEGTTIVAPADGEVYLDGLLSTYGRTLILYHKKEDLYTCYMHISTHSVKKGDTVKKGEPIAQVGTTGNVDAPCLHFEVRKGTKPVNPLDYLP